VKLCEDDYYDGVIPDTKCRDQALRYIQTRPKKNRSVCRFDPLPLTRSACRALSPRRIAKYQNWL